jgi:hypothetical protein
MGSERQQASETPRFGSLMLNGWHGVSRRRVEIVGETAKRYRIRAIEKTKLAGRSRWLNAGETALVPKYAVEVEGCEGR